MHYTKVLHNAAFSSLRLLNSKKGNTLCYFSLKREVTREEEGEIYRREVRDIFY